MNCNLVQILGSEKNIDFESVAALAGINVIVLRHKEAFTNNPVTLRGFQGGKIKVNRRNGEDIYSFYPYKNRNNEDTFTPRNLYFTKDENTKTNENLAVIPDTKYNRKKLASIYYSMNAPLIKDPQINSEIKDMADRLERKVGLTKKKEQQLLETAKELEATQKRNELLEKELKKIKEKGEVFKTLTTTVDNEALIRFVKKRIEKEVFSKKAELIASLKKEGEGWQETDAYRIGVLEEIDKRCIAELKEEGITDVEYKAVT